ncbi:Smi1 protein [Martiniozyma asiatica (nom. inval.)]|nr:Smi1 protein [Martiniozyma asiatica]
MGLFKNLKELFHNITTKDHYAPYNPTGTTSKNTTPLATPRGSSTNLPATAPQPYRPGQRTQLQNDSSIELGGYGDTEPIPELWDRLDNWLEENLPEYGDELEDGATENDLNAFESDLGIQLPYEFRSSFSIHDGQVGLGKVRGLVYGLVLMDLESIAAEVGFWRKALNKLKNLEAEGKLGSAGIGLQDSVPKDWIKAVYYNDAWIPFVKDNVGNNLGLDLSPAEKGKRGQVILFGREFDQKIVVAESFGQWLKMLVEDLENGNWYLDDVEEKLVFKDSQGEKSYFNILKERGLQKGREIDGSVREEPVVKDTDLVRGSERLINPKGRTQKKTGTESSTPIAGKRNVSKEMILNNDSFVVEEDEEDEEKVKEPVVDESVEEKAEEPVVEEKAEEPVVEEKAEEPVEEKAEEPVVEEKAEEPVVEEPVEEKAEEPVVEEPVEEKAEELVEEPVVEEKAEELVEEPVVEELVEEPVVEEPVEEKAEELVEEPVVEEKAEELVEEPVVEEKAEEPVVEEKAEEPVVEEKAEEPVSTDADVSADAEEDADETTEAAETTETVTNTNNNSSSSKNKKKKNKKKKGKK